MLKQGLDELKVCDVWKFAGKCGNIRLEHPRWIFFRKIFCTFTLSVGLVGNITNFVVFSAALFEGLRTSENAVEDEFIRRFMKGTWHNLFLSEIVIKRQNNIIRIAGILYQGITQRKMYFLIGYSEDILSYWLHCPVKLELQTVADRKAIVYKCI